MPTFESARLSTSLTRPGYSISASVSSPSLVFLSDGESSMLTMQASLEASTAPITSGVKLGGVSTTTKSCISRSSG